MMGLRSGDAVAYGWGTLRGYPARTALTLVAMAVGVAAVIFLTALGEGARNYVREQFVSLGSHLIIVVPGRSETAGIAPSTLMGETPRDLTLDDARALLRHRDIRRVAPVTIGSAEVSASGRVRDTAILGTTAEMLGIRHWHMKQGHFLPVMDWDRTLPVAVIGSEIEQALFGARSALGRWLRIGDRRFRIIGVMASEGRSIGIDVEDIVIIPVATAQQIFDQRSLFRVLVEARSRPAIASVRNFIITTIARRHQGEHDVTVITQDAVIGSFDEILVTLTYALAGIAAVSLAVAGILIMNVMLVTVSQHQAEIGLLKALGADRRQILALFMIESLMLSALGAILGLALGLGSEAVLRQSLPALPAHAPGWAIVSALGLALLTGAAFSLLPARRAAWLDPVQSLSRH